MLKSNYCFAPIINTEAGACLTAENWLEVGVKAQSYSLESLLFKPGLELLQQLNNFKGFLGWTKRLVIDAHSLSANKEGIYTLISPYDGSKIRLHSSQLVDLLLHLQPDAVLLPKNLSHEYPEMWNSWNESIQAFVPVEDFGHKASTKAYGIYFIMDTVDGADNLAQQVEKWAPTPIFLAGVFDSNCIKRFKESAVDYIQSNEPAALAIKGQVYNNTGIIDLTDPSMSMAFEVMDPHCGCPTCKQGLTKAYLHHLLINTPLLCQRFLIQHNIWKVMQ